MDDLIDFHRRTRAAQTLAERQGLLETAAALERAIATVLREFVWDGAVILCLLAGPASPPTAGLRVERRAWA